MEHDVVLADEVDEACFGVFPPLLPRVGQQFLGVADVADGSVEPYVEHFALGPFYGYGDTPVEVAAHGTRLQSHVEPRLALTVDVGTPFLVVFENPLAQPAFMLVQREVPVFGFLHDRRAAADSTLGVDELGGAQCRAALLALVAIGTFGMATGALAGDVAVGQESLGFLIIILHGGLFDEFALVVELAEEVGSSLVVHFRRGTSVDVERDAELLERVAYQGVIAVDDVLRCAAFLLGADGDGHSVLVASADKDDVFLLESQVADVDVGRYIDAGQVSDMNRSVGIGQCRCHGSTFEFLFHICMYLFCYERFWK